MCQDVTTSNGANQAGDKNEIWNVELKLQPEKYQDVTDNNAGEW